MSARISVGLAPTCALALLASCSRAPRRPAWAVGVATAIPVAVYAFGNWMRFRTLFSVPLGDQVRAMLDPAARSPAPQLRLLRASVRADLAGRLPPAVGAPFSGWYPFVDFPATRRSSAT